MKTAIVILNWNTKEYLQKFLPFMLRSVEGRDACVIVADNGSTDGSVEMLQSSFPEVRLIALDQNYGFTGGYNKALSQVEAKYYILANSDIEVPQDWLDPLVDWMDSHPECGACGPKILSYYDRTRFEYAGAAGGLADSFGFPYCRGRAMSRVERDNGQYDESADVLWVSGACLMVRSELWKSLGGLDERFFAHMEEIDLCWRIQLHGCKVTAVPSSKIYHVGGGTLKNGSPSKLRLNYRNNILLLQNNLASTFALDLLSKSKHSGSIGEDLYIKIAKKAVAKAGRRIFLRKILDIFSAISYAITGKFAYFAVVFQAHKQARSLGRSRSVEDVARLLSEHPDASVNGLTRGFVFFK